MIGTPPLVRQRDPDAPGAVRRLPTQRTAVPSLRGTDHIGATGLGAAADHLVVPELPGRQTMTTMDVACLPDGEGWTCRVTLADERGSAEHTVDLTSADLARLAPGANDPVDLVRRSFEFLLAHEPRDAILRTFDLTVIGRYFPDYERAIRS